MDVVRAGRCIGMIDDMNWFVKHHRGSALRAEAGVRGFVPLFEARSEVHLSGTPWHMCRCALRGLCGSCVVYKKGFAIVQNVEHFFCN